MTGAWSRSPVGRVVPLTDLGALGPTLGVHHAESRRIRRLQKYPDWIFKEYPTPIPPAGVMRLDRLIQLPKQMTAADRTLADEHTSWPVSRVLDDQQKIIGVLMPLAPPAYSSHRQLPSGRSESRVLEVDVLALTKARQSLLKLPPQSLADRISVCASIAAVGALFERHGLVYLDWSYANIFWSLHDHSAYVIGLDGCSFGPRPQIQAPNWEDPQVPLGQSAGNESDRYRVALLIARCLTGLRANLTDTRSGLFALRMYQGAVSEVAGLLVQALKGGNVAERPSIGDLNGALEAAKVEALRPGPDVSSSQSARDGVTSWKPVSGRTRGNSSAQPCPGGMSPPSPPRSKRAGIQPLRPLEATRNKRRRKRKQIVAGRSSSPPLSLQAAAQDDLVRRFFAEDVQPGQLLFNPPDRMRLGQTERVEVRLTRTLGLDQELREHLRGHGEPHLEEIETAPLMAVTLKGDGFQITAYSDEEQRVTPDSITTWEFDIRAKERGQQRLILCVSLRIPVPGQPAERKSIPVREATIHVQVGAPALVGHFVSDNWRWLIGTAIAIAAVVVTVLIQ
jgi:hypothetical protein